MEKLKLNIKEIPESNKIIEQFNKETLDLISNSNFLSEELNKFYLYLKENFYSDLTQEMYKNIVDNNLVSINDFYNENKNCMSCNGDLNKCLNKYKGYKKSFIFNPDDEEINLAIEPCKFKKIMYLFRKNIIYSDIDFDYIYKIYFRIKQILENRNKNNIEKTPYINKFYELFDDLKNDTLNNSYVFSSNNNANNALLGLASFLALKNKKVAIISCNNFLYDAINYKFNDEMNNIVNEVTNVDYLFVLDFNNAPLSVKNVFDFVTGKLLNARKNKNLHTFISSNDLIKNTFTSFNLNSFNEETLLKLICNIISKEEAKTINIISFDTIEFI